MSSLKQSTLQEAIGITIGVTGAIAVVVAFTGLTLYFVWKKKRTGSSDVSSAEKTLHV